jgi:hypothetical protein
MNKPPSLRVLSVFRSLLFVTCVFTTSILTGQTNTIDPCSQALIQQIDYNALDTTTAYAYLSQIDESTWDSKKKDRGFTGKWTGFLGPMSANVSYADFDEARRNFFKHIQYNETSHTASTQLRKYVSKDQLDKWEECNKDRERYGYGLSLKKAVVNDDQAVFELRWVAPPPGGATEVTITNSRVSGGRSLETGASEGKIYRDGEALKQGSKTFTIAREPSKNLTVSVDAGGYSVADTIGLLTPTPPPPSPTATPDRKRLLELINKGHIQMGEYVGKIYYLNVGKAQEYLTECAAFLHEINHPAAGQLDTWANQADISILADAVNCTVDKILQPFATNGKIVATPSCDNDHQKRHEQSKPTSKFG